MQLTKQTQNTHTL